MFTFLNEIIKYFNMYIIFQKINIISSIFLKEFHNDLEIPFIIKKMNKSKCFFIFNVILFFSSL